jgi:prefoldin subunit 5
MFYEISDWFYTSEYESKRNNYKKKVAKLTSYKNDLDNAIAQCDAAINNYYQIYEGDSKLYGEAIDLFFDRSRELKSKIDSYRERLRNVSNEIGSKIEASSELYNDYVEKCEEEDRELKRKWEED